MDRCERSTTSGRPERVKSSCVLLMASCGGWARMCLAFNLTAPLQIKWGHVRCRLISFIWLFSDTSGQQRFDVVRLREAVRSLPWVQNWRDAYPADDYGNVLFECELADEKKYAPVPIQFRRDGQSLSIGADRQLGLQAALL